MADTDTTPAAARRAIVSASPRPCAHCPWRTEHHGRRTRHGFYRASNLRRLWAGLRGGERMTCHPTDPEMAEFAGFEQTAGCERTLECAGSLVLIQRELTRFHAAAEQAKADGGTALERYRAAVGTRGLTRDGLAAHVFAMLAGPTPLCGGVVPRSMNLNEPGISAPDVPAWGECALDPPEASG
jgi:hypothetical protein